MRPKIHTKCAEDRYAAPNQRIIRVEDKEAEASCYVSARHVRGKLEIEIYELSGDVAVIAPSYALVE